MIHAVGRGQTLAAGIVVRSSDLPNGGPDHIEFSGRKSENDSNPIARVCRAGTWRWKSSFKAGEAASDIGLCLSGSYSQDPVV